MVVNTHLYDERCLSGALDIGRARTESIAQQVTLLRRPHCMRKSRYKRQKIEVEMHDMAINAGGYGECSGMKFVVVPRAVLRCSENAKSVQPSWQAASFLRQTSTTHERTQNHCEWVT